MSTQLQHHLEHLILYSSILWQAGLILFLLLRYLIKRLPKTRIIHTQSGQSGTESKITPQQQTELGAIDVDVSKHIIVGKVDSTSIKTDEIVKGKVKTQKDKLKELRK